VNPPAAGLRVWLIIISLNLLTFGCAAVEVLHPPFPGVEVLENRVGETTAISVRNPQMAEMTVGLDFTLDNLTPSVRLPLELIVPPQSTTPPLVLLRPTDPAKIWQYTFQNDFSWGTPKAQYATNQLYLLPFAPGRSFRVVQGQDGAFSHTGSDRFAIDFGLPEGEPVVAARGGLVVLVRDGFDVGASDSAYKMKVNEIFVRHSDGTLAEYVHLQKDCMKVKVGDAVNAGQILALSGNTGYTRGPHLHFMVFRAKDSKSRESLPVRFVTKEGSGLILQQGRRYTALRDSALTTGH
jgi:murein DD-endopeptidase MepM/ murein hydrolase activator NlpD